MIEAQDYERRLANRLVDQVNHLAGSHSAHRRGWFDYHLDHLCVVDGVLLSSGLAPDSDGRGCVKEIKFPAPGSIAQMIEAQDYERHLANLTLSPSPW